ncbi:MAG TPA: S16 family serine protease, partial [Acidimicrobiales bacterium]
MLTPTPSEQPPAPQARRPWWAVTLLAVAGVLVLAIVLGAFIRIDYFGIVPGDARTVGPRISVEGADTFEPEGHTYFVTVGVPPLSALGAALGWIDPDADIFTKEELLGDRSPAENKEENLKLMGYSKDFATYVALTELGYKVGLSGGGVLIDSLCMEPGDNDTCKQQSPADEVLDRGDLIIKIDETDIHLSSDISVALKGKKPGELADVTVKRQGKGTPVVVAAELTESSDGRTILGIIPNPNPPDDLKFCFPIDVKINSGQVSGPSAGLAFTLALMDELTPGELTGGARVAATGTMMLSGEVGNIGGLRQKTVAVERVDADLFLVPVDEVGIAEEQAKGTNTKVVGVASLDDALAAIATLPGSNALDLGTPGEESSNA